MQTLHESFCEAPSEKRAQVINGHGKFFENQRFCRTGRFERSFDFDEEGFLAHGQLLVVLGRGRIVNLRSPQGMLLEQILVEQNSEGEQVGPVASKTRFL